MKTLPILSKEKIIQSPPEAIAEIPLLRLDWVWLYNPGTLCNLACEHCLTLSSPTSEVLLPLETAEVRAALEEAKAVRDGEPFSIGMTGGEVFLLAQSRFESRLFEQIELALSYGELLVLTNAILATDEHLARLRSIADAAPHPLNFRVSLDGPSPSENDAIRVGLANAPTWERIIAGLHRFKNAGFTPTIAYTYDGEGGKDVVAPRLVAVEARYRASLIAAGLGELELWGIPIFDQGSEFSRRERTGDEHIKSPGITNHCISHYLDHAYHSFQCSYSRAFCKEPDGRIGWYKCAVLPAEGVEAGSRIAGSLAESLAPITLPHSMCITCFRAATQGCAMSCSGE